MRYFNVRVKAVRRFLSDIRASCGYIARTQAWMRLMAAMPRKVVWILVFRPIASRNSWRRPLQVAAISHHKPGNRQTRFDKKLEASLRLRFVSND